ncbi:MAG: Gfo/Idh/MocA family oxidoreductase [Acidobacteriota bacterium]
MIRVGLIGYGLAGTAFHAPFITTTPGLDLTVVVTSDAVRQASARASHPDVEILASADALWQPPRRVDLVVIATANVAHAPLARAAIAAGIPVLVDKPLATTAADARSLVADAARAGVPLTVFQNRRWDGDVRTLRKLLADGALGAPVRFESRFERWRLEARTGWRGSADPSQAGGLLVDLGSHVIDQALWLFGPAADVYAELDRRRPGSEVDDDAFVAITHASGVRSHLWMSILASQRGPRLRLLGTSASYVKFGMDVQEDALRRGETPTGPGWGEEPESAWGRLGDDAHGRAIRTLKGDYGAFYRSLADALVSGGPMPVNPNDAVAVLDVIEAARRSASERRVISLS